MAKIKLEKYIKNKLGEKVESKTTSILITKEQHAFLESKKINVSSLVRDHIDRIMSEYKSPLEEPQTKKVS